MTSIALDNEDWQRIRSALLFQALDDQRFARNNYVAKTALAEECIRRAERAESLAAMIAGVTGPA